MRLSRARTHHAAVRGCYVPRASLAPLDYSPILWPDHDPAPAKSLYPESKERIITDSWGDLGSAAWQLQPSIRFMAYCMRTGESPWWNPYCAAGRMEPEGLYSVTFSPVVLLSATFGGSSTAISFVLLASYYCCGILPNPIAVPVSRNRPSRQLCLSRDLPAE